MGEAFQWKELVSHTESMLLSFARALIANPEVICIERHFLCFDEHIVARIIKLLAEFVQQRGIEVDPARLSLRRLRTCIMTDSGHDMPGLQGVKQRIVHVSFKD